MSQIPVVALVQPRGSIDHVPMDGSGGRNRPDRHALWKVEATHGRAVRGAERKASGDGRARLLPHGCLGEGEGGFPHWRRRSTVHRWTRAHRRVDLAVDDHVLLVVRSGERESGSGLHFGRHGARHIEENGL